MSSNWGHKDEIAFKVFGQNLDYQLPSIGKKLKYLFFLMLKMWKRKNVSKLMIKQAAQIIHSQIV